MVPEGSWGVGVGTRLTLINCILSAGQKHALLYQKHRLDGDSPHGVTGGCPGDGMDDDGLLRARRLKDMVPPSWSCCCGPAEEMLFEEEGRIVTSLLSFLSLSPLKYTLR